MVNIFQIAVERLIELGFYNFLLPFILFSTVLYAVLKKTQILGDSPIIHGILSVVVGLFVFGTPVILGVSLLPELTSFMTQAALIILVFIFGFLIASFFSPNLMEKLPTIFTGGGPVAWLVWATVIAAMSIGLFRFLSDPIKNAITVARIPGELVTITIVLTILFIVLLIVAQAAGKEVK